MAETGHKGRNATELLTTAVGRPTSDTEISRLVLTSFLIPSVFENVRARHLCVFYRQLGTFPRDQVAYLGEAEYFRPPCTLEAEGRPEWNPSWRDAFDYEPPSTLEGVRFRALAPAWIDPILRRTRSSWKLYGAMVTRRLPELEAAIGEGLDSLAAERPLEAVLTFANNPSLVAAARARGLPVVHNEFGPLRKPGYVPNAFWDLRGVSRGSDAAGRFRSFTRECSGGRVPILDRLEILHTLRRAPLPDLCPPEAAPFRIGIALQGEENAYVHGIGALDLFSMAGQHHPPGTILVRPHPGSLARYADRLGVADDSENATAFIGRCASVLTVNSGTALEAVLLGRRAVVVGDSPLALVAQRSVASVTRRREAAHLRALNFLVFGYLVPAALMFEIDYVRWRLSAPSELEIYRHHLRWYREQLALQPPATDGATSVAVGATLVNAVPAAGAVLPLVIFGAGASTPLILRRLQRDRFSPIEIHDNDATRWGTTLGGLTITAPRFRPDTAVLVASLTHADAIVAQLRDLGYRPDRILRLR